jgi:hypothetical protein
MQGGGFQGRGGNADLDHTYQIMAKPAVVVYRPVKLEI